MKKLFSGWSVYEITWLVVFTVINLYLFVAFDDTWIGLAASLTGMMCVVLVAKGRISNYVFGIVNIFLYAYIAYGVSLYGEVMLNLLVYLPLQVMGIYIWKNNQMKRERETVVKAKRLSKKQWMVLVPTLLVASLLYRELLTVIGGAQVGIDSVAVVLSVMANILLVKRYAEQWVMWIVVNMLSIVLWLNVFLTAGESVTILVMWSAYLVNSIYGYVKWLRFSKETVNLEKEERKNGVIVHV